MNLVDTHCHLQLQDYGLSSAEVIAAATAASITKLICVGTDPLDSQQAVKLAETYPNVWATIGIHPHEAARYLHDQKHWQKFRLLANKAKVVAVGECGLDYFYNHSPAEDQKELLKMQLDLATEYNLPLVFHVRQAFDDFWPIFERYPKLRGVLHSFTDSEAHLSRAIKHGLFIGVNGIVTFTKDPAQLTMYRSIPLDHLVLETDAPFLTPTPYRGTINEPKFVGVIANFLAELRGESVEKLALTTTHNVGQLFKI